MYSGVTRPIKMLMHEHKYMNLEPKIPLYVSGFGPRAMQLAGVYGDGLVCAIPPRGMAVPEAMAHAPQGATQVGRSLGGFRPCALTNILLLEPREAEASGSPRRLLCPNV